MSEKNTNNGNTEVAMPKNVHIPPIPKDDNAISLRYILEQVEKIQSQTDYLLEAIMAMKNDTSGGIGMGARNLVEEREKTNRQLIAFYEKMYDDLRKDRILEQKEIILSTAMQTLEYGIPDESGTTLYNVVELALKDLNENK